MRNDQAIMQRIMGEEGFSPKPYKDTKGIATTGYGFNLKDKVMLGMIPKEYQTGGVMPKDVANQVFKKRYDLAVKDAGSYLEGFDSHPEQVQEAIIDMAYNMGLPGLSSFKNTKKMLQSGDYAGASKGVLQSKYAKDVPNRAKRNSQLIAKAAELLDAEQETRRQMR